jgi:hypothetical protein
MSSLYTAEVNGIATMTFCEQLSLQAVVSVFENNDDYRVRMLLEDNVHPRRLDRSFAECGEVTFRPASTSEIARWAATVSVQAGCKSEEGETFDARRTVTFLVPHVSIDWGNEPHQGGLH